MNKRNTDQKKRSLMNLSTNTDLSVIQKQHLGRIAAKLLLNITDDWKITDDQRRILIGAATRTTISTWRQRVNTQRVLQLGNDTYERIECIQAIHLQLMDLVKTSHLSTSDYLRLPQIDLNQKSLLEHMLNGKMLDLYTTLATLKIRNHDYNQVITA